MNINLLPKEHKEQSKFKLKPGSTPKSNSKTKANYIGILIATATIVFGVSFLTGFLFYKISLNEARLNQIQMETNIYSTSYRKVQKIETMLAKISDQKKLNQKISADFIAPLQSLKILTGVKPESVWFEQIDFNGKDGTFILTGGAVNQQTMKLFAENIKNADSIKGVQSKIFTGYNSAGKNYLRFRINGVIHK